MQYLFETIAFTGDKPFYYRAYQLDDYSFFAEVMNQDGESANFVFRKMNADWFAEDVIHQNHAEQIGENIDHWISSQIQRLFFS